MKVIKKRINKSILDAAKSELLLTEQSGFLEADDHEKTYQISQKEIKQAVDITAASKLFELKLEHGPYRFDYFRNGRNLVIGGERGHVSGLDWVTKDLQFEFNVRETVHDVSYLNMPTMIAVAQKDWVHVYDNDGIELHCLKQLYQIKRMTFLPYHFLLAAGSETGFLHYLDVSTGTNVASYRMKHAGGRFTTLVQNKSNAIVHTGHGNGTVALWSPNNPSTPLVKMLVHACPVSGLAIDETGTYMATTGVDRSLKVWDLRNSYNCLFNYKLRTPPSCLSFSQKNGMLAVGLGSVVEVYKDVTQTEIVEPYLRHALETTDSNIRHVDFCNFEDVLGVGHATGFSSVLVPGSGEANFDGFESNPFMTRTQRREMEVKSLLDKVQSELISLDPTELSRVDRVGLKQKLEDKEKVLHVKKKPIEFESKVKSRNSKSAKKFKVKQGLKNAVKLRVVRKLIKEKRKAGGIGGFSEELVIKNTLDRFKAKVVVG